jgi:phosphatidyl-myo-inositol dimannoside synthase
VAGRSGGAPETVQEGRTGYVVDGRSVGQIADAVVKVLADPDRAAGMGSAGRRWVIDNWRWDTHAARLGGLLTG